MKSPSALQRMATYFIATETNTKLSIYVETPSCLMTATFAAYNLLLPMYAVKQMPKATLGGYPANAQNSPPSNIVKSSSRQSSRSSRLPVPNNIQSCGESRRTITTFCPRVSPVQRRPAYRRTRMPWKVSMKFLASRAVISRVAQ